MDYIVSLRRLPTPNTSIEILDRQRYFGGTAGNLARAAGRLGVKVSLASFVGADFPPDYRQALAKEGVDTSDLRTIPRANTPTAWVFSDPKGNQMAVVDQGPMKDCERPSHSIRRKKSITCTPLGFSGSCSVDRPTSSGTRRKSFERDDWPVSHPPRDSCEPPRSSWSHWVRAVASFTRVTGASEFRGFAPAKSSM